LCTPGEHPRVSRSLTLQFPRGGRTGRGRPVGVDQLRAIPTRRAGTDRIGRNRPEMDPAAARSPSDVSVTPAGWEPRPGATKRAEPCGSALPLRRLISGRWPPTSRGSRVPSTRCSSRRRG
jgi:hypothetical protein